MEIINKIRRVYVCQLAHFNRAVVKTFKNEPWRRFCAKHLPKFYAMYYYYNWIGRFPSLRKPRNINEYLIKRTIKYRNDKEFSICADKYAVRQYVKEKLGDEDILTRIYGVWDKFQDIDFDKLPEQFVLKMTNASGRNYICKDKSSMNYASVKAMFDEWVEDNEFGLLSCEWHYTHIRPRIIAEEYLSELGETSLIDYKFNCVKGHVYSCFIAFDRDSDDPHGNVCYDDYDLNWHSTGSIYPEWNKTGRQIERPVLLDKMIEIASALSKDFDFVRVDLYEVKIEGKEKILFGELTFTPNGNVMSFYKQDFLENLGEFYREHAM